MSGVRDWLVCILLNQIGEGKLLAEAAWSLFGSYKLFEV